MHSQPGQDVGQKHSDAQRKELFLENQYDQPWWKTNFFLRERVLFNTWDGVFTSCLIHMLGVIPFLRTGWLLGNVGLFEALLIVLSCCAMSLCSLVAAIKTAAIFEFQGTIHSCISFVIGSRLGGCASIIYCFAQAVGCALHVIGFGECVSGILWNGNISPEHVKKIIGVLLLVALLSINLAGVKWVLRLQLVLLLLILACVLDFGAGLVFFAVSKEFISVANLTEHNIEEPLHFDLNRFSELFWPEPSSHVTFFSATGIFFPAVTGIFSGLNMSSDLRRPDISVAIGTFSALFTAFVIYLIFLFGLTCVCPRIALLTDTLIIQHVSLVQWFLLMGVYVSTVSSSLGTLFGVPRIIQSMASENILPCSNSLAHTRGTNRVPVAAMLLFFIIALLFVLIAQFNHIATIMTVTILFTYAFMEYSYFCLSITLRSQQKASQSAFSAVVRSASAEETLTIVNTENSSLNEYGTTETSGTTNDLDRLFPERVQHRKVSQRQLSPDSSGSSDEHFPDTRSNQDNDANQEEKQYSNLNDNSRVECQRKFREQLNNQVSDQKHDNQCCLVRWLSQPHVMALSALGKVVLMFCIHWKYSILVIGAATLCWVYLGKTCAVQNRGCSEFSLSDYLQNLYVYVSGKKRKECEKIVVKPSTSHCVQVASTVLTEEGKDFAHREKFHHASTSSEIKP